MLFIRGNKCSTVNTDCCERVYLSGPQLSINYSASLYGCNVLYRFSIYGSLGLACSLERYDMHSGRSGFPTPEDKGGSKLAESPVWEQRIHLAQASAQRYCSNKDSPKMKPKACGILSWVCFYFMVFGIHVHTLDCKSVICHKFPCNQTCFFLPSLKPSFPPFTAKPGFASFPLHWSQWILKVCCYFHVSLITKNIKG